MHGIHVHARQRIAAATCTALGAIAEGLSALPRNFDGLLEAFFDPLVARVEVEGTAVFECDLELDCCVLRWNAAAGDGLEQAGPDVRAEPWGCDARVVEVEDRSREGLELRSGRSWEVDDLAFIPCQLPCPTGFWIGILPLTRRFVRWTQPALLCRENGSTPACLAKGCSDSDVRGGEVYSVCSPGRGVKLPSSASITQLSRSERSLLSMVRTRQHRSLRPGSRGERSARYKERWTHFTDMMNCVRSSSYYRLLIPVIPDARRRRDTVAKVCVRTTRIKLGQQQQMRWQLSP